MKKETQTQFKQQKKPEFIFKLAEDEKASTSVYNSFAAFTRKRFQIKLFKFRIYKG